MKKVGVGLFVVALAFMFAVSFVSAADFSQQVTSFIESVAKTIEPILKYTIGDTGGDSSTFVVKTLLFVLMLSVVFVAVGQVPMIGDSKGLRWIVSIVVGILGARFLSTEALVNAVWLPSGVTAITLACIIPFLIFFFFIESFKGARLIRRVGWILYVVIFGTLAAVRWDDLQSSATGWNFAWIYIATAGLALLSFIFDRTIQNLFHQVQTENAQAIGKNKLRIQFMKEYNDAFDGYHKATVPTSKTFYNAAMTDLASRANASGFDDLEKLFEGSKVK